MMTEPEIRAASMTLTPEVRTALIHIKRHIYSKPIKKYIDNLLGTMTLPLNSVQSDYKQADRLYQVTYKMPVYKLDMRC